MLRTTIASKIAVELKSSIGKSRIADLEQALGQALVN
ncbi:MULTISPECIES: element excision factor XisH family protein [unclassified Microcoleus]